MGYVGVPPQSGFITTAKQRVTSSTNNYVDLDHSISSLSDCIVWVNFVKQDSTNLTLTTSSRITLGATLVASDIVEIAYLGKAVATQTPSSGTVTNDMLAGSIANSKLANSSITLNGSAVSLGGSATINNTPSFRVDLRSNQSITSGSETVIQFGNTVFDTASGWDSSNYEYTIPETGKWFIANVVRCSGGGNNTISAVDVNLFEDSNMLSHFGLTANTSGAVGIFAGSSAGVYSLTQGDEIKVKATISASAPRVDGRSDGGFTHLSGVKLG